MSPTFVHDLSVEALLDEDLISSPSFNFAMIFRSRSEPTMMLSPRRDAFFLPMVALS